MRKKVNRKRVVSKITLFVSAVLLMVVTFHSCQQDEMILESEEIGLKSSTVSEIVLDFPGDEVNAGEDFYITFSSSCGRIMIERGFTAEVDEYGEIINKMYTGLTCDTENLFWEAVGEDVFESCQGATITENLTDPGIYVYRAKLNFKAVKNSGCQDCGDFVGNQFECFTVTVAAGGGNENEGTFTDARDDKIYKWIKIGNQIWMAENLAFLPESGSYAYANNEDNVATYGRLYSWDAAMASCPAGWHLPTNNEWDILINYLAANEYGLEENATWVAKALASTTGWETSEYSGNPGYEPELNNSSGFTAIPGGTRDHYAFWYMGRSACFWTATESSSGSLLATYREVNFSTPWVSTYPYNYKLNAYSVRCVKDAE